MVLEILSEQKHSLKEELECDIILAEFDGSF
jgi:hypothetical protein